ncbi:MAG TPA: SDR family NAD(P)-dependent oxidoreductase, partial [Acidimicrobiia bacterium]
MELSGRSILVTGGSSGIGRAVAVAYANEGATVWVVARRRGPLEQTLAMGPPGMIRPVVA